jgi:hypothetical protein
MDRMKLKTISSSYILKKKFNQEVGRYRAIGRVSIPVGAAMAALKEWQRMTGWTGAPCTKFIGQQKYFQKKKGIKI